MAPPVFYMDNAVVGPIRVPDGHSISASPLSGVDRVYVAFHTDPDGLNTGNVADVYVLESTDGGMTWTNPVQGCASPTSLGCSVDPETGAREIVPVVAHESLGCLLVTWYNQREGGSNEWNIMGRTTCDGSFTDRPSFYISPFFTVTTGYDPFFRSLCDAGL